MVSITILISSIDILSQNTLSSDLGFCLSQGIVLGFCFSLPPVMKMVQRRCCATTDRMRVWTKSQGDSCFDVMGLVHHEKVLRFGSTSTILRGVSDSSFLVAIRNHTSANGLWSVTKRVDVDVTKRVICDLGRIKDPSGGSFEGCRPLVLI